MTRAGKERAEDVKRAFRRAIELAGLRAESVRMHKRSAAGVRMVLGTTNPEGWPHKTPALSLIAHVGFDGAVGTVEIQCSASDGDPVLELFRAAKLRQCHCDLADLDTTLKEVWAARREVMARLADGETPPIFDGKWHWAIVDHMDFLSDIL